MKREKEKGDRDLLFNKIKYTYSFGLFLFAGIMSICLSCSSAPKNAGDITDLRRNAEFALDAGNKLAAQGKFENALILIDESKRGGIITDDSSLIIRTSLSRGNVLFSLGRTNEAFTEWDNAITEAQLINNSELLSACRIFRARGALLSGRSPAVDVLNEVNREQPNIKTNRQYIAFSWQVKGLALRALESYSEAENALLRSLDIHLKDRYLENASYDWYTIASVRSLAGNHAGAIQAIENSIAIDRRIENSWGLAASWKAMGDVLLKMGRVQEAAAAHARSRSIQEAM